MSEKTPFSAQLYNLAFPKEIEHLFASEHTRGLLIFSPQRQYRSSSEPTNCILLPRHAKTGMQLCMKSLVNPRKVLWKKGSKMHCRKNNNSLCSQNQHGTISAVLPQGMQEGNGSTMQEGRAPVPLLLFGVYQL